MCLSRSVRKEKQLLEGENDISSVVFCFNIYVDIIS